MVIAPEKFRDEEYLEPRKKFEEKGYNVTVASEKTGTSTGMLGAKAKIDVALDDVQTPDYDAIVFVGGGGARTYFENPQAHGLAKKFMQEGKIVSAICIAPSILAKAQILKNRKATVYPNDETKKILGENQAIYTNKPVVTDGKIVTADGPQSAKEFAEAIIRKLEETQ